jgi:hypothetical protein
MTVGMRVVGRQRREFKTAQRMIEPKISSTDSMPSAIRA